MRKRLQSNWSVERVSLGKAHVPGWAGENVTRLIVLP